MADLTVKEAYGIFSGTVGSTDINRGDLVYFDGTDWELADATDNTKFAEGISIYDVDSGDPGVFCVSALFDDIDAPYTQGDQYFLSETAGEITATRPTTLASLRQLVGFGVSTTLLRVDIKPVSEVHQWIPTQSSAVTTEATTALDSGNFAGPTANADGEIWYVVTNVPQNCVGLEFARVWGAGEVVTGATDVTVTVSGATDGEQWDATTEDATLTTLVITGAVADEIQGSTLTTGLDAAGIIQPDNLVGIKMVYDGGQTDIVINFGVEIVYLVV